MVEEITDQTIAEKIKKGKKVVVDCYADWCGPCRMLSPVIEALAKQYSDISFCKLNIDDNEETAMKYSIMSIPTLLIFESGELKNTVVGLRSKRELEEIIKG